jgi:replication factor C small subunit
MFFGGTVPLLLHNSDERGIETVRTTIKNYARSSTLGTMSFKILFLDESDNLTSEAQASLRRLMERYASLCRFILSCNYSSRIIPPIQSRCAVFRFRPLKIEDMKNYLERIATAEGKAVEPEAYDAILRLSMGDMRQAVNILQQASAISPKVDADTVYESSALPLPKEVEDMLAPALKGEFRAAREKLYALLTEKGASGEDVLKAIHSYLPSLAIPDIEKVRLVDYLAEMEFRMVEGASSRIQLEALLARLALPHLTSKP